MALDTHRKIPREYRARKSDFTYVALRKRRRIFDQARLKMGCWKETIIMLAMTPMFAAAGYALLYLLFGGGLGGALLIFIVAKMLGK
jgi:hypothetical protein